MGKKSLIHLQSGHKISGTLRGYDIFLNLVIDDAQEETTPAQRYPIGVIVRCIISGFLPSMSADVQIGYPQ